MVYKLIELILFLLCFRNIYAQNDDQKEVEWGQDDARWTDKVPNWWDEAKFIPPEGPTEEKTKTFWLENGQKILDQKLNQKLNFNIAKNIIIFIGDGMSLSTQMAARSYLNDVNSELSFEKFSHSGLSKTYCINYQVPDSASTATAILSGVKVNYGTLGLTGEVNLRNCTGQRDNSTHVETIFKFAQNAGKSTGIVTTTRITHATPAAAYAHSSSRYWESNENTPEGCDDIALQLIHGEVGSRLDVAMGGGRRHFLSINDGSGLRTDNRNLIKEYQEKHGSSTRVVYNKTQLNQLDSDEITKVLGLFSHSHLAYKMLSDPNQQPTLTEMTSKALEILSKNKNGYLLLVEGGRIDTSHHETKAKLALDETVEFQNAVDFVKMNTVEDETLILVTADHSSAFSVSGYIPRGYNILGPGDYSTIDKMWQFSLSYANGPSYDDHFESNKGRQDPRGKHYLDPSFRQPTTVPMDEETHAGEDVGVYANGPFSHLFTGVYEQNYIAHALMYASCLGPENIKKNPGCTNGTHSIFLPIFPKMCLICFILLFLKQLV